MANGSGGSGSGRAGGQASGRAGRESSVNQAGNQAGNQARERLGNQAMMVTEVLVLITFVLLVGVAKWHDKGKYSVISQLGPKNWAKWLAQSRPGGMIKENLYTDWAIGPRLGQRLVELS
jgi:hypothetical protein